MFKNMKIKRKLVIIFIAITAVASMSGIVSAFITKSINGEFGSAIKNYGFSQGDVGKVLACFGSVDVSCRDSINYLNTEDSKAAQKLYEEQLEKMDGYFDNVEATISESDTMSEFKKAKEAWEAYVPLANELIKEGDTDDAKIIEKVQIRMADELDPLYNTIYNSLAEVLFDKVDDGNAEVKRLDRSANISFLITVVMIVISMILVLTVGTAIANSISNPIMACADRLRKLSEGDLRTDVPVVAGGEKNETVILAEATETIVSGLRTIIGDQTYLLKEMADGNFDIKSRVREKYIGDFSEMLLSIREINHRLSDSLSQINQGSEQVSSGAEQVSTAAQSLSQGASEQAASVEELAGTVEDISHQVEKNAHNAEVASERAHQVGTDMDESNKKMKTMIAAMDEINDSSKEIGKIIKTIEDIAFQTNILALNAAVEAARAGAAGKGFAVVADEVRNLASKSAEASKNTSSLIEHSVKAVENGAAIVDETAEVMIKAVDGTKDVVKILEEISEASVKQAESVDAVTKNIEQISSVVQMNSATSEESAASSEELSGQAQLLKNLVAEFRLRSEQ